MHLTGKMHFEALGWIFDHVLGLKLEEPIIKGLSNLLLQDEPKAALGAEEAVRIMRNTNLLFKRLDEESQFSEQNAKDALAKKALDLCQGDLAKSLRLLEKFALSLNKKGRPLHAMSSSDIFKEFAAFSPES